MKQKKSVNDINDELYDVWSEIGNAVYEQAKHLEMLCMIQGMLWLLMKDNRTTSLPETDEGLHEQFQFISNLCKKIRKNTSSVEDGMSAVVQSLPKELDRTLGSEERINGKTEYQMHMSALSHVPAYEQVDILWDMMEAHDAINSRVISAGNGFQEFAQIKGILKTNLRGKDNKRLRDLLRSLKSVPGWNANAVKFKFLEEIIES